MDFWFLVFLFTVAILIAVGGALLLVGYLGTLPASFDHGWRVWIPTLLLPVIGFSWLAVQGGLGTALVTLVAAATFIGRRCGRSRVQV